MTERPVLFSAPMVRALLDGSKTQTRRVVKHEAPDDADGCPWLDIDGHHTFAWTTNGDDQDIMASAEQFPCPYGQPGDRLWWREAWRACRDLNRTAPRDIDPDSSIEYEATKRSYAEIGLTGKLRQSMFMPRWASRITLEITGVRVERLQDISEADALAEGVWTGSSGMLEAGRRGAKLNHIGAYRKLWESINGPGSWAANPWVWVVEFKRVTS